MKKNKISQTGVPVNTSLRFQTGPLCRILLVDDYRAIRQLIPEVLVNSGYEVDTADDGAAAWEVLQVKPFNLLITDNEMPRLTGVELIRKLRSAGMTLPVIMTSGSFPAEELAQNPSLQLAAMLPKPFSPEELLGTVTNVLTATVCGNAATMANEHAWTGLLQPAGSARRLVGRPDPGLLLRMAGIQDAVKCCQRAWL